MNPKTGPMIQSWILPTDVSPYLAVKQENGDEACCGYCPLKPLHVSSLVQKSCYVARRAFQAPNSIWKKYNNKKIQLREFKNVIKLLPKPIRYGSYGDIAMIPQNDFESIHSYICNYLNTKTHTAYTHQHAHAFAYWTRRYAMASVENIYDARLFRAFGWRTFRIGDNPDQDEIWCPNLTNNIQCIKCGLCNGKKNASDNRKSIVIKAH